MTTSFLIILIQTLSRILFLVVFVDILLSYFLPPYHQIRVVLDRIVQPLLQPIRKILPTFQGIDFSPIVLIILIQVVTALLTGLLR